MSPSLIIGLEMALVLGGVLGFGVWELWRLRRDKLASRQADEAGPPAPPSQH